MYFPRNVFVLSSRYPRPHMALTQHRWRSVTHWVRVRDATKALVQRNSALVQYTLKAAIDAVSAEIHAQKSSNPEAIRTAIVIQKDKLEMENRRLQSHRSNVKMDIRDLALITLEFPESKRKPLHVNMEEVASAMEGFGLFREWSKSHGWSFQRSNLELDHLSYQYKAHIDALFHDGSSSAVLMNIRTGSEPIMHTDFFEMAAGMEAYEQNYKNTVKDLKVHGYILWIAEKPKEEVRWKIFEVDRDVYFPGYLASAFYVESLRPENELSQLHSKG